MAQMINPYSTPNSCFPRSRPASTAVTTSSPWSPLSEWKMGENRVSTYTTPSWCASSIISKATRSRASAVCITPQVCANPSRYNGRLPRCAPRWNHPASSPASVVGRPW